MTYEQVEVAGAAGIIAKIILDSIAPDGTRLTTYETEYPRLVLAELNTHKMLNKNSSSSRAIPFKKMIEQLRGKPVRFGAAQAGMQDNGQDFYGNIKVTEYAEHPNGLQDEGSRALYLKMSFNEEPEEAWEAARDEAIQRSGEFYNAGYHKQVYNRLTEPFQMMKTVVTATEWNNFFWLRNHEAADPTLAELARCMADAREQSVPQKLQPGEWHLPHVSFTRHHGRADYYIHEKMDEMLVTTVLSLEDAKKVSAARTAAVSFRNTDYGLDKCREVYDRLVGGDRKHASAFEHAGTPMTPEMWPQGCVSQVNHAHLPCTWEPGVSHMTRDGKLWSGNLKGWVQLRKLIDGECVQG